MWCCGLRWYSCTKSICWDLFVWVIVLKNITYSSDSLDVFVSPIVLAMQRVMLSWITIWQGKIDSDVQIDLTSSKHILKEVGWPNLLELYNFNCTFLELYTLLAINELVKCEETCSQKLVVTWSRRSIEVDFDLLIEIIILAKHILGYRYFVPVLFASVLRFNLWFVNWLVFVWH